MQAILILYAGLHVIGTAGGISMDVETQRLSSMEECQAVGRAAESLSASKAITWTCVEVTGEGTGDGLGRKEH